MGSSEQEPMCVTKTIADVHREEGLGVIPRRWISTAVASAMGGLSALGGGAVAWLVLVVCGWQIDMVTARAFLPALFVLGVLATWLRTAWRAQLHEEPAVALSTNPDRTPAEQVVADTDRAATPTSEAPAAEARGSISIPLREEWWKQSQRATEGRDGEQAGTPFPVQAIRPLPTSVVAQCPECGEHRLRVEPGPGQLDLTCTRSSCGHSWSWQPDAPWPRTSVRPPPSQPRRRRVVSGSTDLSYPYQES